MLTLKMKKLRPRGRNYVGRSPSSLGLRRPCLLPTRPAWHQLQGSGRQQRGPGSLPPGPTGGVCVCVVGGTVLSSLCFLIAWKQS